MTVLATISKRIWPGPIVSFCLGLLAAFAFPPFNILPLLWLAFPALVLLLQDTGEKYNPTSLRAQRSNPKSSEAGLQRLWIASGLKALAMTKRDGQAFALGWCFAFGLLMPRLYWIAASLFVDIKSFWWAVPLAVAGLPAFFAIYYGLAALVARRWGFDRLHSLFFFVLCWFGAEVARAHMFTGFPWDILGYVWADCLPVLQITSVIGIEGLTLLTILLAVLPIGPFLSPNKRYAFAFLAGVVLLFVGVALWGQHRLDHAVIATVPDMKLRLVQPGTDQAMKWQAKHRQENFEKLLDLTFAQSSASPITHFIWPETATAYYLTEEPGVRAEIARRMPEGSTLLTGVVRRQIGEDSRYRYYNSLIVMDSKGAVVGAYDKHHLVPFGEYMPMRSVIPLRTLTALGTDFKAGEGIRTIRALNMPPLSPLVCYEAIFSGEVAETEDAPKLLINVTNDAWYEGTIGPGQHFLIARVRAIEEGLPLIRVANKGISSVIDPLGRVVAETGLQSPGYVDSDVSEPLATKTIMGKQGVRLSWLIALVILIVVVLARIHARRL